MPNATLRAVARKARTFIPGPIDQSLGAVLSRRESRRWLAEEGVFLLGLEVAERFDYTVQSGPFRGLRYTRSAVLSRHATPMLVGQYERQLYPVLMDAARRTDLVIDVGHAEGYYAVGLARRGKRVVAFDVDPNEGQICKEMARLNGVNDRVSLRRWCKGSMLLALTGTERALIICDIEGGEYELFPPAVIEQLSHCDLIVEMHSQSEEENDRFVRRFEGTHRVHTIDHPKELAGAERLSFLGRDALRMAAEYRPFQQWMVARTKTCSVERADSSVDFLELTALQ